MIGRVLIVGGNVTAYDGYGQEAFHGTLAEVGQRVIEEANVATRFQQAGVPRGDVWDITREQFEDAVKGASDA